MTSKNAAYKSTQLYTSLLSGRKVGEGEEMPSLTINLLSLILYAELLTLYVELRNASTYNVTLHDLTIASP